MKIRIKFAKEGCNKFLGHLDTMRYFQKAIRRAQLPITFSEGFSPHMLLSFAAPLGVGITSTGEYFDLVLKDPGETVPMLTSAEIKDRLNAQMVEGMEVLSVVQVPDNKASNAMALVAAADYTITFREGYQPDFDLKGELEQFFAQEKIVILRKTKRSEKETDIRPWIYSLESDGKQVQMQLSTGSVSNLKPDLVMEAFYQWKGLELAQFAIQVHRDELYGDVSRIDGTRELVPLDGLGAVIE